MTLHLVTKGSASLEINNSRVGGLLMFFYQGGKQLDKVNGPGLWL